MENEQTQFHTLRFFVAGIFFILLFYTCYFTRDLVIPFIFALLFNFLLSPVVKFLRKFYIPTQISAAIIIMIGILIIGYGIYGLTKPATSWANKGPEAINVIHQRLSNLAYFVSTPFKTISKANEEVSSFIQKAEIKQEPTSTVKEPKLLGSVFMTTWQFLAQAGIFFVSLYLLLISDDFLLRKIVNWLSSIEQKKEAVIITREIQKQVWKYLFARTVVNAGLGIVVAILMYFLKMPDPILWGVMVGILEFIPYVGAIFSVIVITLVALISFPSLGYAFFISLLFFVLIAIEGNIITPIVLGRTFTIQPIIVFLGLIFWGWLWGIAGIFIAVPLMMTLKIIIDVLYQESLMKEFLSA